MLNNSLYGNFRTRTFSEIFPDFDTFKAEYEGNVIPVSVPSATVLPIIYGLMYSRYGNSHIASSDENRFKTAVMSNIYTYAPTWWRKKQVQETLRTLTEDEILQGGYEIFNHADHPGGQIPQTSGVLPGINSQNTSDRRAAKVDSYIRLYGILRADDTAEFLDKFKNLFLKIVKPELPLWYITDPTGFWWTDIEQED